MYEVLIRLYYQLEYTRYTIDDLKEMKRILDMYKGKQIEEVKLKKLVKEKDKE